MLSLVLEAAQRLAHVDFRCWALTLHVLWVQLSSLGEAGDVGKLSLAVLCASSVYSRHRFSTKNVTIRHKVKALQVQA